MINDIDDLWRNGQIRSLDRHLAAMLGRRFGGDARAPLLFALVSRAAGDGHSCLDSAVFPHLPRYRELNGLIDFASIRTAKSSAIGEPGEYLPIIRDGDRFYLHRYFHHEKLIARRLAERLATEKQWCDAERLRRTIDDAGLFAQAEQTVNWQRVAAALAALSGFAVVSGGPGTGKTTTVAGLLAIMLKLGIVEARRVALAAPTGKAAARLSASIAGATRALGRNDIPTQVSTIHRLLGARDGAASFHHDRQTPLAMDLLIVDEVSMIDVELMAALLDAVPARAGLVLLGDRNQLVSVNPGLVFGDICAAAGEGGFAAAMRGSLQRATGALLPARESLSPLGDHFVTLQVSYRYGAQSAIGTLAPLVNEGRGEDALALLEGGRSDEASLAPLDKSAEQLIELAARHYGRAMRNGDAAALFSSLERFRILCAVRRGPWGVERMNGVIEAGLARQGLIDCSRGPIYRHRPIIITCNDYALRLFNGDTGIFLHDRGEGRIMAVFPDPEGGLRRIAPSRLPPHETAFALTVHKAQGSEFEHVALLLPPGDVPVVGRELIYTALTRAKESVTIFAERRAFVEAVASRALRMSGLGRQIRFALTGETGPGPA